MAAASSSSSPCVPLERIAGATPSRPDPTSVYRSALTGKHILVTGGLGYIGSHTCVELIQTGARVTIVDNLYNAHAQVLNRIQYLTGIIDDNICKWINVDLRNMAELEKVFSSNHFDAVIHFAGLKAVGESVDIPLKYWDYNINGALNLFHLMEKYNCKSLVFSSSATVYGNQTHCPITETASLSSTNPYGATKLTIENICRDIEIGKEKGWAIALLRYFNPIGAHPTGLIGEDPKGIPNNLVPFVTQVAVGKRPHVNVFGSDYPTVDGTGVRDYIHVVDLARGHLAALANAIFSKEWKEKLSVEGGANIVTPYNLGTGSGSSVLEVIAAVKSACGREVPYKIAPRRAGDVATCYSDPSKAQKELLWKTEFSLQDAINHSWKWQSSHPDGYLTPNIQLK